MMAWTDTTNSETTPFMATLGGGGKVWDSQASCSPWTSGKPLTTQARFQLKKAKATDPQ